MPPRATSDRGSEPDSPTIDEATTFTHTFAATGTFTYHCTFHPYTVGTIVVLAASVTPPPTDTLADVGGSTSGSALPSALLLTGGPALGLAGLLARHRQSSR